MDKNDRIGFRLPAELKSTLVHIAKKEGRSLAQICELLLRAGASAYRREGPKYLHRFVAHPKGTSSFT
jgi:hypothetical protein